MIRNPQIQIFDSDHLLDSCEKYTCQLLNNAVKNRQEGKGLTLLGPAENSTTDVARFTYSEEICKRIPEINFVRGDVQRGCAIVTAYTQFTASKLELGTRTIQFPFIFRYATAMLDFLCREDIQRYPSVTILNAVHVDKLYKSLTSNHITGKLMIKSIFFVDPELCDFLTLKEG